MRSFALMLLVAPLVVGCASVKTQSVSSQSVDAWRGKSVVLSARPRASLVMMTAGKAALGGLGGIVGGALGAGAAISAGNAIAQEDHIADPAPMVAQELLQMAEKRYGVVAASLPPPKVDTTDVAQLAQAAHGADLLFDVRSLGETVNYYPTRWGHYWVSSGLVLQVIDVHTGTVVGEAVCSENSQHQSDPPTKHDLLDHQGQLLKLMLSIQWDDCRDQLADKVLRVNTAQAAAGSGAYAEAQSGR